jgi:hypothetical protein
VPIGPALIHQLWTDALDDIEREDSRLNFDASRYAPQEPIFKPGALSDILTFQVRENVDTTLLERALCQLSSWQDSRTFFTSSRISVCHSHGRPL